MAKLKYMGADGEFYEINIGKDGHLYQIVPKSRVDEVLQKGKIMPKKLKPNADTVPLVETINPTLAAKGKIFFTPSPEISKNLATGTGYSDGVIHKIPVKAVEGMTVYHDPHVQSGVPSFFVTEPISAKTVEYSYDGQKYLGYTEVARHITEIPKKVAILVNVQQEIKDFVHVNKPTLGEGLTIGFNLGRNQIGGISVSAADLLDIPSARKVLDKISLKAATKSLGTTQDDLAKILKESIKKGDGAQKLAAAIGDKYDLEYLGRRSMTIARTEGTGVLNAGTFTQMEEDNMKMKKWRATLGDGRTRQTHLDAHQRYQNDPIPVDQLFQVGDSEGMYPADQRLHIKERAQCRCALVGADLDELRCRHYDRYFIREHGHYERKLQQSVRIYFKRMKDRIISRVDKVPLP